MKEIEYDGFITREEDLMAKSKKRLDDFWERMGGHEKTAKPMQECKYPKCEECDKYVDGYCTVPMVVSKQIYRYTQDEIAKMQNDIAELNELVTDEILGSHNHKVMDESRAFDIMILKENVGRLNRINNLEPIKSMDDLKQIAEENRQ